MLRCDVCDAKFKFENPRLNPKKFYRRHRVKFSFNGRKFNLTDLNKSTCLGAYHIQRKVPR